MRLRDALTEDEYKLLKRALAAVAGRLKEEKAESAIHGWHLSHLRGCARLRGDTDCAGIVEVLRDRGPRPLGPELSRIIRKLEKLSDQKAERAALRRRWLQGEDVPLEKP